MWKNLYWGLRLAGFKLSYLRGWGFERFWAQTIHGIEPLKGAVRSGKVGCSHPAFAVNQLIPRKGPLNPKHPQTTNQHTLHESARCASTGGRVSRARRWSGSLLWNSWRQCGLEGLRSLYKVWGFRGIVTNYSGHSH